MLTFWSIMNYLFCLSVLSNLLIVVPVLPWLLKNGQNSLTIGLWICPLAGLTCWLLPCLFGLRWLSGFCGCFLFSGIPPRADCFHTSFWSCLIIVCHCCTSFLCCLEVISVSFDCVACDGKMSVNSLLSLLIKYTYWYCWCLHTPPSSSFPGLNIKYFLNSGFGLDQFIILVHLVNCW